LESENQPKNKIDLEFISQFDTGSIYTANAFRLLQLPITATDREITRRKQTLEISRKTQAPAPDGPCKISPLDPDEINLDLNNLVDSLRDPVKRFYQEFFWFWPVSDNEEQSDPGHPPQVASSINKPVKIFSLDANDPREAAINLHNLAIFNHFCALNNPQSKSKTEINEFWREAYKYWSDLAILSDFWSLLSNRVREVNDPRLSDTLVTTLRNSALSIFSYTIAQQAVRLIENDDIQGSQELLELIPNNQRNLPRNNILKLATTTNRERLLAIESAVKQVTENDPAHCDDEIESLITESCGELKVINTLFSNASTEFTTLRDGLIETVFNALDVFFIKTEDYHRCIELTKKTYQIPTNSKIEKEINTYLEKYTDFGDNRQFWHCKNYFNNGIPPELFNRLEAAREIYERQDYEVTIKTLDQIVLEHQSQPVLLREAIYPPLALTLNQQAIALQNKGAMYLTASRSVVDAIVRNVTNENERCLRTLYILENGTLRYSRYNEIDLYCMSCLSTIYGTYYTGELKGVPYITCERCEMTDRTEVNNFKRQAHPFLDQAKDCLMRANLIQPENKLVRKNLEFIRDIFKDVYSVSIDIDQHIRTKKTSEDVVAQLRGRSSMRVTTSNLSATNTETSKKPASTALPSAAAKPQLKPVSVSASNSSTNKTETLKKPAPTALPTKAANAKTRPVPQQKNRPKKSPNKGLITAAVIINLAVIILLLFLVFGISPEENAASWNPALLETILTP